jgi:hypothetical protein
MDGLHRDGASRWASGVAQNGSNACDVSGNGAGVVGFDGVGLANADDAFRWTEAGGLSGLGLRTAVATVVFGRRHCYPRVWSAEIGSS